MQILPQAIPEVLLLVPQVHGDARGFFVEAARKRVRKAFASWFSPTSRAAGVVCYSGCIISWCSRKESSCAAPKARCLMWPWIHSAAPTRLANWWGCCSTTWPITSSGCRRGLPMAFNH